jgi:integrase
MRPRIRIDEQHLTAAVGALAAAGLEIVKVEMDRQGRIAISTASTIERKRDLTVFNEVDRTRLEAVGRKYLKHETKRGLRSATHYRWCLERWVFPELGTLEIRFLKRSNIVHLVDEVGRQSGPAMAREVFSVLRRVLNWYAARDDDFKSPIEPGMAREVVARARPRDRILDDNELRALWRATDGHGWPFGALVRFLLLTGARRSEAQRMRWTELNIETGDWVLPASRNKVCHALVRPLSCVALAILNGRPRLGEYVFTRTGSFPIGNLSRCKRLLDEASGVSGWTLHDVRRTARSLMSRVGVPERHAEECLGHVQPGVSATYDRHTYYDEKRCAYERLAAEIGRIVNGGFPELYRGSCGGPSA